MHELQGESGRQFDPLIVAALHEHLAHPEPVAEPAEVAWSS